MDLKKAFFIALLCFCFHQLNARVIKQNGYTLSFSSQNVAFSKDIEDKMIKAFFEVYPQLVHNYNKNASKEVVFVIDTAYKGVAETSGNRVVFSAKYMSIHPKDVDVVTHEVMHIVQAYGESDAPGWLTEGIADYVRYKYGVIHDTTIWKLPEFCTTQNYTDAYKTTARFLVWLEEKVKPGIVKDFNTQLRKHTFTNDSWKNETGKTVDELWMAYAANPTI